ncbi:MAG: orotidine-5'-phosphate decarboxylase [Clostridia bacterium]|nr:orotidine-5'-phosphate decarboxylase [Clostridia bacterium]
MSVIDGLIEKIIAMQNPTCVGLDTIVDYLPEDMKAKVADNATAAEQILIFNKKIIDSVYDIVPSVKIQIACYEMYGAAGIACFEQTANYAKEKGLFVIADGKRNDIGNTAGFYANAFLGENATCAVDFLTVNGYLGTDGIAPFSNTCKAYDKGLFALVKTSNPSSGEFQNLKLENGQTVYEYMGKLVEKWGEDLVGKYGYSSVGAVVGATHPEEAANLRAQLKSVFFLIPGYGAQGGNAEMLKCCFDENGLGGVVNNSRGVLCAYKKKGGTYFDAARATCIEMQQDLANTIGKMGK